MSRNTAPERSQLQQIIAGLTEGVILLEPDQTITYANDAALDMHGVTRLEELGLALRQVMLWCKEAEEHGFFPWFGDLQAARTDSGRPRSSIRLRTVTAIRVSTSWAGRVCERKVSPMMRLYRLIVPSAPALAL